MSQTHRPSLASSFFLVIALITVATLMYRVLTADPQATIEEYRRPAEAALPARKSMVTKDRLAMMIGENITVNRTRLVYKGLRNGAICLDLYLLDLDAQYPYPKQIPRAVAQEGFRLGTGQYQMVTANRKALTLKIIN